MSPSLCVLLVDDDPADLELARTAFEEQATWVSVITCTSSLDRSGRPARPGRWYR